MTNDIETRALVITWNGEALPDYIVGKIMDAVRMNACGGNESSICVKQHDGQDLSAMLVKQLNVNKSEIPMSTEAVKNALKYIGTRYCSKLGDSVMFTIALLRDESDDKVRNAVEILATHPVPGAWASEYGITRSCLNTIRNVHRSYMT